MKNKWHIVLTGISIVLVIYLVSVIVIPFGILERPGSVVRDDSSSQVSGSEIYTLPIGGYESAYAHTTSNNSLDINYTFYSRNWGPGKVTYEINATDFYGKVPVKILKASIEPAVFTAEPGRNYTSKVHIETGPAFGSTSERCETGYCQGGGVSLVMNATLENQKSYLCEDIFTVFSLSGSITPGLPGTHSDFLEIEQSRLALNPGDTIYDNIRFNRGQGIGAISYEIQDTPLNVTIAPSEFIANKVASPYPSVITIHADHDLPTGIYPLYLNAVGGTGVTFTKKLLIPVNVTAPGSVSRHP
jgi:hypothetical protein